jgi:hypothetical protein
VFPVRYELKSHILFRCVSSHKSVEPTDQNSVNMHKKPRDICTSETNTRE